jgi:hypothetical protein
MKGSVIAGNNRVKENRNKKRKNRKVILLISLIVG